MVVQIKSQPTRTVEQCRRFLEKNRVPAKYLQIPALFEKAASPLGVNFNVALAQSIVETGWFTFKGDVKPGQNNFAGIGTVGGGVAGESFPTMEVGCLAQVQHLASYAGIFIEKNRLVSARTKKVVDWIFGKAHTVDDLSGKWAADHNYGLKILSILGALENDDEPAEESPAQDSTITWIEMNRLDSGTPTATAYAGPVAKYTRKLSNITELVHFFAFFPNARTILVAETSKIVPRLPDYGMPRTTGKRGLLDPGHSERHTGARSRNRMIEEENLNRLVASTMQQRFAERGIVADIWDPIDDNLTEIGKRAAGYDFFISCHENSYDGWGQPGAEVLIDNDKGSTSSAMLASRVSAAIANTLGLKDRGAKRQGLAVLDAAEQVCKGPCILIEGFFITNLVDVQEANRMAIRSAYAAADATADYLL